MKRYIETKTSFSETACALTANLHKYLSEIGNLRTDQNTACMNIPWRFLSMPDFINISYVCEYLSRARCGLPKRWVVAN